VRLWSAGEVVRKTQREAREIMGMLRKVLPCCIVWSLRGNVVDIGYGRMLWFEAFDVRDQLEISRILA
jgi:hypothetical protein